MLKRLQERLEKKEAQKADLVKRAKATEDIKELRGFNLDIEVLNEDIAELRSMILEVERAQETEEEQLDQIGESRGSSLDSNEQMDPLGTYDVNSSSGASRSQELLNQEAEKRGKALKELRAVTVASSDIVLPTHTAKGINGTFNEVSGLLDRVNVEMLKGGESYKKAYIKGYGEGGYTGEGEDYTDAEPQFGYATVNKTKVTAYAEISEEATKLPAANYDGEVQKGVRVAMRKKMTKDILVGPGTAGTLAGIFTTAADAIDPATDKEISEINEDTLSEIVYNFGGDEDVEDEAVLILSKPDLKVFAQLRNTTSGNLIHKVINKGNTGTIDGIPYLINSACKSIANSATAEGSYCMAYGPLSNYTLGVFSDTEIQRSTDFKFKSGMICNKGNVMAGGNVTAHNGFLRVKKGPVS